VLKPKSEQYLSTISIYIVAELKPPKAWPALLVTAHRSDRTL